MLRLNSSVNKYELERVNSTDVCQAPSKIQDSTKPKRRNGWCRKLSDRFYLFKIFWSSSTQTVQLNTISSHIEGDFQNVRTRGTFWLFDILRQQQEGGWRKPGPFGDTLVLFKKQIKVCWSFSFKGNLRSSILIKVGSPTTFPVWVHNNSTITF